MKLEMELRVKSSTSSSRFLFRFDDEKRFPISSTPRLKNSAFNSHLNHAQHHRSDNNN